MTPPFGCLSEGTVAGVNQSMNTYPESWQIKYEVTCTFRCSKSLKLKIPGLLSFLLMFEKPANHFKMLHKFDDLLSSQKNGKGLKGPELFPGKK